MDSERRLDDVLQARVQAEEPRPNQFVNQLGAHESEDDNDIHEEVEDTVEAGQPFIAARTENFQEASPACIRKMKLIVASLALIVLVTILFVAPMPLAHVECVQDTIQDSL